MMGGDVTVTSEPGKGSVFTVRLPGGPTLTALMLDHLPIPPPIVGGSTVVVGSTIVGGSAVVVAAAVSTSGVAIVASVHPPVNSAVTPISDGPCLIDLQF
jgi:hypothetical protein